MASSGCTSGGLGRSSRLGMAGRLGLAGSAAARLRSVVEGSSVAQMGRKPGLPGSSEPAGNLKLAGCAAAAACLGSSFLESCLDELVGTTDTAALVERSGRQDQSEFVVSCCERAVLGRSFGAELAAWLAGSSRGGDGAGCLGDVLGLGSRIVVVESTESPARSGALRLADAGICRRAVGLHTTGTLDHSGRQQNHRPCFQALRHDWSDCFRPLFRRVDHLVVRFGGVRLWWCLTEHR